MRKRERDRKRKRERWSLVFSLTPVLSPEELQGLLGGKVLLDRVVDPLNQHVREACLLQQIGLGGRMSKRVYGPARLGLNTCWGQ